MDFSARPPRPGAGWPSQRKGKDPDAYCSRDPEESVLLLSPERITRYSCDMPTHCLISFGSNLGDRDTVLARAAQWVDRSGVVARLQDGCPSGGATDDIGGLWASRLFETPPIGGPGGQSPFLNAVAAFATEASAADVLDVLQQAEQKLGRLRNDRWGARSIDLDVVLHGQLAGQASAGQRGLIGGRGPFGAGNSLLVPHPRYTARRFVLVPACDVAADFVDPRFGWTLADVAAHLDAAPPSMALAGGDKNLRQTICSRLASEYSIASVDAEALTSRGTHATVAWDREQPWVSPSVPAVLRENHTEHRQGAETPESGVTNQETKAIQTSGLPRLIARIERTSETTRWPAPHRMWPASWRWPEYRLEVDDLDWAVQEIASALDSMRCPVRPVSEDGNWWKQ